MRNDLAFALTLLAALAASSTLSVSGAFASQETEESADRVVDRASVDMQDEADRDLSALAAKYRGTPRESEMLMRLAGLRMEIAESLFRVEYGPGESAMKSAHSAKLASAIAPLSRILSAYPKSEAAPRALFLRGKAEKELDRKAALSDLEAFLSKYSKRDEAPLAAMGVADLAIDRQNYSRAITVLGVVVAKPSHALYPNALAKRAWALQANGDPYAAVGDLRTLAAWFRARAQAGKLSAGDASLRESVQSDVPTIGYLAYTKSPKKFGLEDLNALLRSFDTADGYRRMAFRVTEHFRIADMNPELRAWKTIVLKSDPSKEHNLPMLIGVLEYDLDREAFDDASKTVVDLSSIVASNPSAPEADSARNLTVKAIAALTKRLTDYRKTAKATDAEKWLAIVVPAFDRMAPNDARRFVIRWNLGETYFSLDRFDSATAAYRWIATNWSDETVLPPALAKVCSKSSASLKAIAARYEGLRAAGLVPAKLEASASIAKPVRDPAKIAMVREWIGWIDEASKAKGSVLEEFEFEADRTLYFIGFQDEGMERMKAFSTRAPGLKVSVPAASLVVDTWIARKRWDRVEEESRAFASIQGWAKPGFSKEMAARAASAKFERAESAYAAKSWGEASKQASEYVKSYGKTEHAIDTAGIVCNSALNAGEVDDAVSCFSSFATTYAGTKASVDALRTAARLEDDHMHFAAAQDLYGRYLSAAKKTLPASESLAIRKRILMLARATGEASRMEHPSRALCSPKLEAVCETNQALSALSRGTEGARGVSISLRKAATARPELRSIWAMLALEAGWETMDVRTLERATKAVSANWNRTEASARYILIAKATRIFPELVARDRESLKALRIDASEKSMTRRLNALKSIEARVNAVASVPVNAVRSAAMQALFGCYDDLIADFRAIPIAKNAAPAQVAEHHRLVAALAEPFVLKSRKIRDASVSLALREQAGLSSESIDSVWSEPMSNARAGTAPEALRKEWSKAISSSNWVRVAFLSDEAGARAGIPSGWAKAARAVSLSKAGAISEARAVFGDACRSASDSPSVREACRSLVRIAAQKGRG